MEMSVAHKFIKDCKGLMSENVNTNPSSLLNNIHSMGQNLAEYVIDAGYAGKCPCLVTSFYEGLCFDKADDEPDSIEECVHNLGETVHAVLDALEDAGNTQPHSDAEIVSAFRTGLLLGLAEA
jgi:hypothetical protein